MDFRSGGSVMQPSRRGVHDAGGMYRWCDRSVRIRWRKRVVSAHRVVIRGSRVGFPDPSEGAALAVAVLDARAARGG